jgi:hypothetical protein
MLKASMDECTRSEIMRLGIIATAVDGPTTPARSIIVGTSAKKTIFLRFVISPDEITE